MAEYRIKCWTECDFSSKLEAGRQQEILLETTGSGAIEILIKGDITADGEPKFAMLCDDFLLNGNMYPAGSRIVPTTRLSLTSNTPNSIVIGKIEAASGLSSEAVVFSNGQIEPQQRFLHMSGTPSETRSDPTFFARGTLIETPHGAIPIEQLEDGDEVMTPEGDIQLITGLNRQRFSGLDLALFPALIPVRIMAGALTGGRPGHDLLVSQGHRLVVDDWRAAYFFGEEEILVPAKSLLNNTSVVLEDHRSGVEYFEITVENSGLVCANGLWAETQALDVTDDNALAPITPELTRAPDLPRIRTIALVA